MTKKKKNVLVAWQYDGAVGSMFRSRGWHVYNAYMKGDENPDLICFTGGEDVSPYLYGETEMDCTHSNLKRDEFEESVFNKFPNIPKVGICRGGQLLNVLCGGELWQDVKGHSKKHRITDVFIYKDQFTVSSRHHQLMIPAPQGDILAFAEEGYDFTSSKPRNPPNYDPEVVWYDKQKCLCFQPHPEYHEYQDCREYFFELIDKLCFEPAGKEG